MKTMNLRQAARAALFAAAGALAGCGGGSADSEESLRTAQAATPPCTGDGCTALRLSIQGRDLLDAAGRKVRLRGVNVDGLDVLLEK